MPLGLKYFIERYLLWILKLNNPQNKIGMICPKCETEASGNFCANCGHKLFLGYCSNCKKEVFSNYCAHCGVLFNQQTLIKNVKALVLQLGFRKLILTKLGSPAKTNFIQKFFDQMDFAFASMKDFEVKKLADVLDHVCTESNMNKRLAATRSLDLTFDQAVIKSLCVLAANGYLIDSAKDAQNGMVIMAIVPPEISSWGGSLLIAIEKKHGETNLIFNASIRGLTYELEQRRRVIKRIVTEIEEIAIENLDNLS